MVGVPLSGLWHGPLPRAAETAYVVAQQLPSTVVVQELDAAGDYIPCVPTREEIGADAADAVLASLADVTHDEARSGAVLAAEAIDLLTGPADGDEDHDHLVITHAFTIGWLLRHAFGAPPWRWWGQYSCHAALTVIRYAPDRPPSVVVANDMSHLPEDLRWTGFPPELRI